MNTDPALAQRISTNVARLRAQIDQAARDAGRSPDEIRLIGVTKTRTVAEVQALIAAGIADLGENRAQDLAARAADPALRELAQRWHMIGQCQTNKVGGLQPWVSVWHSVDRTDLIDRLAARAAGAKVLIQVDTTGLAGRGGAAVADVPALVERAQRASLAVIGLMTVAPSDASPDDSFATVDRLAGELDLRERSMGMSNDFEAAIRHGATMIRIGRALFDDRHQVPAPAR